MTNSPRTGLLVLHGNRLELLAEAVFAWLTANKLNPLEEEVFLVQSNGMAEWLKMEIATAHGICAATRVELPARFIWRAYRTVLGSSAVPRTSALDKLPLTWRLMRLLPELSSQPGFEPVAAFLGAGDAARRLQLAQRLADLLDQYQVYRSDWLRDWGTDQDRLRPGLGDAAGQAVLVPPDQLWQPALWRALLQTLAPEEKGAARPELHQLFLQALQQQPEARRMPGLPRRVVLFGTTHIPHQTLEAIAALSAHCQVLMAVPNPCRYHWADIIDGRQLLRTARRRHASRPGPDLSQLPLQDMHAHGHPLLAAWGRQGRDFVRQLDAFDDVQAARERFSAPRVDLFDDGPGLNLLQQVQATIRDLVPLCEHPQVDVDADDRSIVFHVAHGAHREVEILHDQLLDLFAKATPQRPLNPRDVVVMVPDIDTFAPAIRAVFGQHARGHTRHIPWGIADQKDRGHQPILVVLEWLLRAPQQRFGASEVQGLLDVPSVARRYSIEADDLPTVVSWIEGAGVRWGLSVAHRESLGLAAGGEQNTWAFGLRRMLLGYATGALDGDGSEGVFAGIEPYAEIAGLSAGMAGALADLLQALTSWWSESSVPRPPARWAERLRTLIADFFKANDDTDRAVLAALDDALTSWLHACEVADFDDDVNVDVAREADEMLGWLQPIWKDKKHPARKGLPGEANATRWIQALKGWATDPAAVLPDVKTGAARLTGTAVMEAFEPGTTVAVPSCFADFEVLMLSLKSLPGRGPALRLHAAARVAERMQQMKRQAGTFGFADMLDRLDAALDESVHGAKAQRLRQRILDQYPVALIDEFQDTSPVQLRIFDRLYRIADNDPARALLLIGDPKQAIYGFRGADIYSYLGARQATEGRHHVLGTNHRSTKALVAAVNFMFTAAEDRPGEGAFMFRGGVESADEADGRSALPFVAVEAKGREERLVTSSGDTSPITAVIDAELRNAADSRELFAALCAERIVTLLNDAHAGFAEAGEPLKRLRPADMAVLVRTGTEAEAVRHALRRRGLASVYLSDKDTVFQTDEAPDLLRLLQSVAAPRDVRLARAAFATALLGLTLEELVALATDDERFDRQCEALQQLNLVWKNQGVLAMIRRALHAFGLPARLLSLNTGAGERRLTNVLHLAELLQAASAQVDGDQALIRWLTQQIEDGDAGLTGGDELVLRLESDADLVKVVTVHKSKGLEYPLVFLPFLAHFREVDSDKNAVLLLPGFGGPPELVLSPTKAQVAVAEKERQREYLRLLYVALTRARHALWVGLSGLQVGQAKAYIWHRSAIGYLLSGPVQQPPEQRVQDVEALGNGCKYVVVQQVPTTEGQPFPDLTRVRAREAPPPLATPPVYAARFDRNWAISSYSALVRDAAWGPADSGQVPARAMLEDEPDENDKADGVSIATYPPAVQPWHRFPRGAFAGNFLHDLLEWLASEGFVLDTSSSLQHALVRRCERQGWGHRSDDVLAWLRQVCTTTLPALGAPLAALATVTPEMEFWFPSDGMQASRVDSLCRQYLQPGRDRPVLPERSLKGMLMGFADLVFEHEGRYWVLDYKSNALGLRDADYTGDAMEAAMLEHRYDVQAALYLLALHRLLRARLGAAYAPAQHLGGAIYYFLRGVRSATGGCCHVAPPLALLKALDEMLLPSPNVVTGEAA